MAPFIFTTDEFIEGTVMANYTGGAPVHGNLTLKASIHPCPNAKINLENSHSICEKYLNFVSN